MDKSAKVLQHLPRFQTALQDFQQIVEGQIKSGSKFGSEDWLQNILQKILNLIIYAVNATKYFQAQVEIFHDEFKDLENLPGMLNKKPFKR